MEISPELCAAIAKLKINDWKHDAIVARFRSRFPNFNKNTVTDALEEAEKLGFLTKPSLDLDACERNGVSEEKINAVILGGELMEGLQQRSTCLLGIHIHCPTGGYAKDDYDVLLPGFALYAGRQMADIMSRSAAETIGVSWGKTPGVVIDAVPPVNSNGPARKVFPVCGWPLSRSTNNRGASENAARLHEILNGKDSGFKYGLPLVPAIIPADSQTDFEALFENYSPGYREIFGSGPIGNRKGGLVSDADMLLTSVSTQDVLGSLLEADVEKWAGIDIAQLLKECKGDIAGVLLPDSARGAGSQIRKFDQHWTGITRHDLELCAWRARPSPKRSARKPTGVCVVAIGENKAATVLEAMLIPHVSSEDRTGLISHLICDLQLANKLLALARKRGIRFENRDDGKRS